MKLDPNIHIVMHSILFLKPGETVGRGETSSRTQSRPVVDAALRMASWLPLLAGFIFGRCAGWNGMVRSRWFRSCMF